MEQQWSLFTHNSPGISRRIQCDKYLMLKMLNVAQGKMALHNQWFLFF